MAKGVKTDNAKKMEIITSYALTNSYNATSKEVGVSDQTVKRVIQEYKKTKPEELERIVEQKKELFQDKANKIIDKQLQLLDRRVNTALNNEDELEEIVDMIWQQDKKELNETQKKAIVNKIRKMQLNSLSEITTSMGTLYDKMRLAKGESTENTTFKVEVEVIE